jgi:hypothetical protein
MNDLETGLIVYFVISFLFMLVVGGDHINPFYEMRIKDKDSNTISIFSLIAFVWYCISNLFHFILLFGGGLIGLAFVGILYGGIYVSEHLKKVKIYKFK